MNKVDMHMVLNELPALAGVLELKYELFTAGLPLDNVPTEYLLTFFWSTAPLAPTKEYSSFELLQGRYSNENDTDLFMNIDKPDGGVVVYPVDLNRSEGGT
jgi:hypothetical protein